MIVPGVIGGIIAAALSAIAVRTQRTARLGRDGWRTLYPSWYLMGAMIGCGAMTGLFVFILVSGGSTLPDADVQNRYLVGLVTAFSAMTMYSIWLGFGRTFRWRGDVLEIRSVFGQSRSVKLSDLSAIVENNWSGNYCLSIRHHAPLTVSRYLNGIDEMLENAAGRL